MILLIVVGIIIVIILLLIIFAIYKIRHGIDAFKKSAEADNFWARLFMSVGQAIEQKIAADKAPRILSIADKKKNLIENTGLKTFYYLDEGQIELLYPQISGELNLTAVTVRQTDENNGSLTASIPNAIGAEIGRNSSNETIRSFSTTDNIISKYNAVERFFMDKHSLSFGIEEFDFDEQAWNSFKRDCGIMEATYKYKISEENQEAHWKTIQKNKAYDHLQLIKSASGYIVIQAEFLVKQVTDMNYVLHYDHTINKFLEEQEAVKIETICSKVYLKSSALQNFANGKSIQLTLLGKVIRWDNSASILEINPIAIY